MRKEHVFKKPVLIAWKLFKSEAIGGLKSPFVFITVKSMQIRACCNGHECHLFIKKMHVQDFE